MGLLKKKETKKMKIKTCRVPTNIIVREIMKARPAVIHLFGRYFWDGDFKKILIGDKKFSKKG